METNNEEIFVGSRYIQVKDETNNISFPVLVQYPTHQPSSPATFGPYTIDISTDARILEGHFPIVIISHGNGGSHLLYRTISTYLAKSGYVVVMIEHYGNNRDNNELERSIVNLQYRPRHVSLTIDKLLSENAFGQSILLDKIAIIGHSFGGYTALALAGGTPWTQTGNKVEVQNDPRIKALVLMAPAAAYYTPEGSLDKVNIPILLLVAEHDQFIPKKWTAEVVINGVHDKSKLTVRIIDNAGHFSFISPFPTTMKSPTFLPSTDPDGFDREEFHRQLPKEILNFLNDKLKENQ